MSYPKLNPQHKSSSRITGQRRPVRAIVEIVDGELRVFPIADCDTDERRILDALRFAVQDFRQ